MTQDDWFQTATGGIFPVQGFGPAHIHIRDIAHALALQCRFAGHCKTFYSVGQHSVLVSRLVTEEHGLQALLHDAAEAYLSDVPAPFKHLLPDYEAFEKKVMQAICVRFGLPEEMPLDVKFADLIMLATERRDVLVPAPKTWESLVGAEPVPIRIVPWDWRHARIEFLDTFRRLMK